MEFLKKHWAWFVFVPLAITATVLVVVAVTTHEEAGFDGAPAWGPDDIPLTVCAHEYADRSTGSSTFNSGVDAAMTAIEARTGRLFVWVADGQPCDIEVLLGAPGDAGEASDGGGAMRFVERGDRLICSVSTTWVHGPIASYVVEHELGHCLGLAHDESGVMAPQVLAPNENPPPTRPWLSDHDAALLREHYGLP